MQTKFRLDDNFESLIESVQGCTACPSMEGCTRVLSWANGDPGADVMFVGEAPGRLGADRTAIPFHGDTAGDNFERLLALAGLSRSQVFVTNAVLCNPRDAKGNNTAPSRENLVNCALNLNRQIDVIKPKVVVTLGSAALESTRLIERHELKLSTDVRSVHIWNGIKIIPFYHPGARAMIHRNFANQSADYYFLGEFIRRQFGTSYRNGRSRAPRDTESWAIVRYVIQKLRTISLFRLHKTLYLIDYRYFLSTGSRITDFIYIRQKDGPYCVELGSRWFREFSKEIHTSRNGEATILSWKEFSLFEDEIPLDPVIKNFIDIFIQDSSSASDLVLKSMSYLTKPMKNALKAERAGIRQLNRPLL